MVCLAVLPDGTLASGSQDRTIRIWNPRTGAHLRTLRGHSSRTGSVGSLSVLPDGTLASGSNDKTIRIWDPISGRWVCLFMLSPLDVKKWFAKEVGPPPSCLRTLKGHVDPVDKLSGGLLASLGCDPRQPYNDPRPVFVWE